MTTLADKEILSGADNRPPMLEKDMYDSWKSIMELYMMNRQHGRVILESVENGPLIWPTIEENGVTKPRKYFELSRTNTIQADCDVNSGPLLEFHQTLMMRMQLCFNRFSSRSITSTGSSMKRSLSSMCTSSNEIANGSSDKHFFRLTRYIDVTLLAISSRLNSLLNLYYLLGCFMNKFRTGELGGNGYDKNGTKSEQNRTKPSIIQKAWKSQQSEFNKKSSPVKAKKASNGRKYKFRD
uniref:Uncharacterized protein n=1 Tax=Tanacetum cinerariifolium TaxID=118510 RepID=A0A6L2MK67_TANCI|nr:hypothetical protein [Tanacetum cinerariifolium]